MCPIPSWTTTARIITDENPATIIPTWKTSVHTTAFRPPCMRNSTYQIQRGSRALALHSHAAKSNVTKQIMHDRLILFYPWTEIILYWDVQKLHPAICSRHAGLSVRCTKDYSGHTHRLSQYFLHHIPWFRSSFVSKD